MDLFTNFELLLCFDKLTQCAGWIKDKEGRRIQYKNIVHYKHFGVECVWFAGVKFEKKNGQITLKDLDYADMPEARAIVSERYIKRMIKLIMETDTETLYCNRANNMFFKNHIRGVCRFGDDLNKDMTDDRRAEIKKDLQELNVLEVAVKHNLSEHYVKQIKNEKV